MHTAISSLSVFHVHVPAMELTDQCWKELLINKININEYRTANDFHWTKKFCPALPATLALLNFIHVVKVAIGCT